MMLYRVYLCRPAFHQLLHRTLWTLFGAPTSTFSRTLRRAEEALSKALNGFFPLMKVQQPSNADLQNAMCNGWLHAVFVTGRILTPLKDGDFEHLYQSSEVQQERFDHSTFERGLHQNGLPAGARERKVQQLGDDRDVHLGDRTAASYAGSGVRGALGASPAVQAKRRWGWKVGV
ncbi:hypothetical protein PC119_g17678 [Phytophthora cactorum]|nr:hypothetical protein PC119_g17678 [Phytophthora cactorum]KAG3006814.1 hypothetical protein PC120_g17135 [Phytophthora cactorum]KAG3141896.1 hypothetical protein C6341_g19597 [Phytophthora cactorum]